jgi:hypothetical protein
VLHSRTEHIEVRNHFLRDNVEKGNIDLIHIPTKKQLVDILTNPLDQATFVHLREELGVIFPFLSFGWEGCRTYACSISFMYHIMFPSLYHRLPL